MIAPALIAEWDGECLRPVQQSRAAERLETGRRYQIEVVEQRSAESHRHYFACIRAAWENLPQQADNMRWPSPDHLRSWALIKAGYYTEKAWVCGTQLEALRLKSLAEALDAFAVVVMQGNIVAVFRAKSQSYAAMGRDEFNASKQKVLEVLAELIGVTVEELTANAGAGGAA